MYKDKISSSIQSVYNDRLYDIDVVINSANKSFDITNRDSYSIKVSIFIEGYWLINYNDRNVPILNSDGTRERIFQYIDKNDLEKIENHVKNLIAFDEKRLDSVLIQCIQYNREKQFTEEDGAWRRKKQTTLALLGGLISLILLFISTIIYRLIKNEIARRVKIREEELKGMNNNPPYD